MSYADYLQSPQWRELRAKARERSGGHCEMCGGEASHVHHVRYPKRYKDDNLDNLLVLCTTCHARVHGIRGVLMPNDDIQVFTFGNIKCSVKMVNDKPLFEIRGLMRALGVIHSPAADDYRRAGFREEQAVANAVARFQRGLKSDEMQLFDEPVGDNKTVTKTYVTEGGMYHLLFLVHSPDAENFMRWVTHEVLPEIRSTGRYSMPGGVNSLPSYSSLSNEEIKKALAGSLRAMERIDVHDEKIVELESSLAQEREAREQQFLAVIERVGEINESWVVGHIRCQQHKREGRWKGPALTRELTKSIGQDVADRCRRDGIQLPEKVQYGGYLVNQYPQKYWDAECQRRGYIH